MKIIYTSEDGSISLDTKLENDTIWLTQKQMAELFDVKTPAISKHLKNIFKTGELREDVVISILETTTKLMEIKELLQVAFCIF